jgi:cytochrome b pre-mRNA-processing protein 3
MIFPLIWRSRQRATISGLYGMIVAQARMPCFYRDYEVPDTLSGRFELIVLHLALVLERFAKDSGLRGLGQALFDHFCHDMDHNLREIGVGDLAVPKEMRKIGEAFYGRAEAYRAALAAADDAALAESLMRNIYGVVGPRPAAARLAAYMREAVGGLENQASAGLAAGALHFPSPSTRAEVG